MKLSRTVTRWPSARRAGTMMEPRYPAPPVTRMERESLFINIDQRPPPGGEGSFAGMVEDFMQALNLWREIVRIIADKETTVVSKVGIRDTAVDDIVVVVLNNVVF